MKKRLLICLFLSVAMPGILTGCRIDNVQQEEPVSGSIEGVNRDTGKSGKVKEDTDQECIRISPETEIKELEDGFSVVRYEGDYGFDGFLEQGGADSDAGVAEYLTDQMASNGLKILFGGSPFGCSTLTVARSGGGYLFGRNFDWDSCEGLIVSSRPEQGYASVSTVNMDFIQAGGFDLSQFPDSVRAAIGLYAPLDGMNEKGLAVSVNMIQDSDTIRQDTGKPDLTTTTAVRLLLDQAADVREAVALLGQYDLNASMGMMVHYALADAEGNSVAVEYIENEMVVTDTSAVTNFYLAQGEKYGIGTGQSHARYEILNQALEEHETMTETEMRDILDSVSKDNFGEFESTEWSIVMDQETKELTYYHRENYETAYVMPVE